MRKIALTVLIVLAIVFTLQNMHPVMLTFIVWSVSTVAALSIILALMLGIVIGFLLALPSVIRNKQASKKSLRHAKELESVIKQQTSENSHTPPSTH